MSAALVLGWVQHERVSERNSYARMQEQTVLIVVKDGQGSGIIVERGDRVFLWTANHVVGNSPQVMVKQFIRTKGRKVGEVSFIARIMARDVERDLALLWVDCPPGFFRAAKFAEDGVPLVGTKVVHVGNVLGAEFDGSVSTGIISQVGVLPVDPSWPWKRPTDQGTFSAFYGGSGGPVFYHSNSKVAGILVGGLVGRGYINYVPVREILVFARKNGVSWAVYGRSCPKDEALESLVLRVNAFNVN